MEAMWANGSEIATLTSGLIVFYLITTRMGAAGYGYFIGAQTLVAVLAMLSSAWVGLLLVQEVVREKSPVAPVLHACLSLVLGGGALGVGLALALGSVLLPGLSLSTLALLAVAELLGAALVMIAGALLQADDNYSGSAKLRAGLVALRLGAVVLVVATGAVSLWSIAVAYAGVSLVSGISAVVVVCRRQAIPLGLAGPTWSLTRSGLSYAGTLVSFSLQEDADKILLVRLADPVTAGVYAVAYRAVQLALVPIRALTASSHRAFLHHDRDAVGEHVRRSSRYTAVAATYGAFAVILLWVCSPAVPAILGREYDAAPTMIALLAPLVILRALSLFAFNGLMGLRRNGVRLVVISTSAALNVLLNAGLIHYSGWEGAALATLASDLFFVVATWWALVAFQRRHDFRIGVSPSDRYVDRGNDLGDLREGQALR